jgi:hypothetical protein
LVLMSNYFAEAAELLEKRTWYRGPHKEYRRPAECTWTAVVTVWSRHGDGGLLDNNVQERVTRAMNEAIRLIDPSYEGTTKRSITLWNDHQAKRKKDAVAVLRKAGEIYALHEDI